MIIQDYELSVLEGAETGNGYVQMKHGQVYTLRLKNGNSARCDCEIRIDGKHVGTFRLNAFQSMLLERPANDTGRFTFYREGTEEARKAAIETGASQNGLVSAVFKPETKPPPVSEPFGQQWNSYGGPITRGMSGGTGLSGNSGQQFRSVSALNYSGLNVAINLRLVCADASSEPRPLSEVGNPVPARID
jgi:hypothetical protein